MLLQGYITPTSFFDTLTTPCKYTCPSATVRIFLYKYQHQFTQSTLLIYSILSGVRMQMAIPQLMPPYFHIYVPPSALDTLASTTQLSHIHQSTEALLTFSSTSHNAQRLLQSISGVEYLPYQPSPSLESKKAVLLRCQSSCQSLCVMLACR